MRCILLRLALAAGLMTTAAQAAPAPAPAPPAPAAAPAGSAPAQNRIPEPLPTGPMAALAMVGGDRSLFLDLGSLRPSSEAVSATLVAITPDAADGVTFRVYSVLISCAGARPRLFASTAYNERGAALGNAGMPDYPDGLWGVIKGVVCDGRATPARVENREEALRFARKSLADKRGAALYAPPTGLLAATPAPTGKASGPSYIALDGQVRKGDTVEVTEVLVNIGSRGDAKQPRYFVVRDLYDCKAMSGRILGGEAYFAGGQAAGSVAPAAQPTVFKPNPYREAVFGMLCQGKPPAHTVTGVAGALAEAGLTP